MRFSGQRLVLCVAAAKVLLHLLTATRYGYFVDEFYYYACSEHLHWGYIDHPPLVAGLMWVTTHVFGSSLLGMRIVPALLGGALVWIVGKITRELGGGRFAQALAACAVLAAPIYLMTFHFFSMNAVEPVIWAGCTCAAVMAIRRNDARYWILFGVLCGIGAENKYSIVLFAAGALVGLLLSPARKALLTVQFWIGMLLGFLVFLPNFLWLMHNNFPFLQWRSVMAQRGDLLRVPTGQFLWQQLLWTGASCVVWIAGVVYFLVRKEGRPYRFAGITYIVVIATLIVSGGKTPYAAPVYGFLMAGGAVLLEQVARGRKWLQGSLLTLLLATGALLAPCFVPILPIDRVVAYQSHIPLPLPIQTERYALTQKFPQVFSLETGWNEMVAQVAGVYHHLTPEQQAQAGILTFHYATAGAIDLLGPKYGLPKPISTGMSWQYWGPRNVHGEVLILVGDLFPPSYCKGWQEGPRVVSPYMYPNVGLQGQIIHVCYGLKFDLQRQWGGLPWY